MAPAARFTTLYTGDTELSADSVEWCHQDELHAKYFACGTYQLLGQVVEDAEKKRQVRKGRVYLYQYDGASVERLQAIETDGILDMKWLPAWSDESGPILVIGTAMGQVETFELQRETQSLVKRTCLQLIEDVEQQPLALSLDWKPGEAGGVELAVSDSDGGLNVLTYTPQGTLSRLSAWHSHGFEAWTCAFDRWSPQILYSGGDDMYLIAHDLRSAGEQRIWTNRSHQGGVTSLLSHPTHEHHLITGSYDEKLRLFDTRFMKRTLAELELEGGIWRLKPHPIHQDLLLAACMYKNFSVVQGPELQLLGVYEEHKCICYGADWAPGEDLTMGTCSFSDKMLCVSRVELSK
ncbi:hypothetical protein KR018_003561 [Drosophila ironensis]|nr:hypothetical protein KR018_003561 [Drosophila ironensis]